MAKSRTNVSSVNDAIKDIKNNKILPIYYLFGEDSFNLQLALRAIENVFKPIIQSDFDKETIYGEDKQLTEILDFAAAFPFGSEKKLIIFKEFDKVKDKKSLAAYSNSPVDFTTIVFFHEGSISSLSSEPYKSLAANKYLFEAKELKGNYLVDWIIEYVKENGKIISRENARFLVDIVGENRSLIEDQIEKILIFLADKKEIDIDSIKSLSTHLKEYTIFDLQNSIGKRNKKNAVKVALNMLDKGAEPTFIIAMLTRYFTGLSRVGELNQQNIPDQAAARIVGTHPYYYKDYKDAQRKFSNNDLAKSVRALLAADVQVKTTSTQNRTIILQLIGEILEGK